MQSVPSFIEDNKKWEKKKKNKKKRKVMRQRKDKQNRREERIINDSIINLPFFRIISLCRDPFCPLNPIARNFPSLFILLK
jgi:hypothetical protein